MCGKFHLNSNDSDYLKKRYGPSFDVPTGDIFPTREALVIFQRNGIETGLKSFGLKRKSLIINARSETIFEKPTFRHLNGCIIPCSSFYEWNRNKEMVTFYKEGQLLYLAGLYSGNEFVILTTEANASMVDVHPRMPLILPENMILRWISPGNDVQSLLKTEPILLDRFQNNEQLSLF